ncbi:MAG: B12-binding domain-containing radical SAM protein [Spirochaetaceae bacterium]
MSRRPRALLLVPPVYDFALYDLHIAPFGLARVGRALEHAGWEVRLVDALSTDDPVSRAALGRPRRRSDGTGKLFRRRVPWPESGRLAAPPPQRSFGRYGILGESLAARVAGAFDGAGVDLALVSSGMTYWYPGVVEAVRTVRQTHPRTPVCVGGTYATLLPEHCARVTGADLVVPGPAERGEGRRRLEALLGRRGLPVPDWSAGVPAVVPTGRGSAAVRLNEGCPYRCDYCAAYRIAPELRYGDGVAAFSEVRRLLETAGVVDFAFYDDALLAGKRRVFETFLDAAVRYRRAGAPRAPRFHLPNAVHMRHLDAETAHLMFAAGMQEVRMGFESAEQGFHEAHDAASGDGEHSAHAGGKAKATDLSEAVELLTDAGFRPEQVGVYVLAGLPRQCREEVEHSVRTAGAQGIQVYVSEFSPVPGSVLFEKAAALSRYPIAEEPLYQNNTLLPLAWEGFTTGDLSAVKEYAAGLRRECRLRPAHTEP